MSKWTVAYYNADCSDFEKVKESKKTGTEMTEFTPIIWGHGDFDAIPFDNVEEARRIGETACARHGVGAYTITNDDNKGNLRQYLFQRVDGAWKLRGKQTATYGNLKRWFA